MYKNTNGYDPSDHNDYYDSYVVGVLIGSVISCLWSPLYIPSYGVPSTIGVWYLVLYV